MPSNTTKWTIREREKGSWEVLKNNRKSKGGFRSQTDAEGYVRFKTEPDDKVFLEADDGYKEDITRSIRPGRKGWRTR